jgi:3-methyladenine DNA glycosylase AlkD
MRRRLRPRAYSEPVQVSEVLAWLKRRGTKKNRDGMARYAIVSDKAFGVSMATMARLGKTLRGDHDLAMELWKSGWYEARMLATLIDDPTEVTSEQMEAWCRDFDNWAICDTACFKLFDRSALAWKKIRPWSRRRAEFERRAAFALIASLALHDKKAPDEAFLDLFPIVEAGADDERNFVKKGVSWALRGIGHRNAPLHAAALDLGLHLAASSEHTPRWIGKDVLRDLQRPVVRRKLERATRARHASGASRRSGE